MQLLAGLEFRSHRHQELTPGTCKLRRILRFCSASVAARKAGWNLLNLFLLFIYFAVLEFPFNVMPNIASLVFSILLFPKCVLNLLLSLPIMADKADPTPPLWHS